MILSTDVDRVLGSWWGCSEVEGGGDAISKEGLEQLPMAARDKDPRWESADLGGLAGEEGGEGDGVVVSGVARLPRGFPRTTSLALVFHGTLTKYSFLGHFCDEY